jgi:hypothetical protein
MTGNKFDKNRNKKSYAIKNNLCEILEFNYKKYFNIKYRCKKIKHKKLFFENNVNGI